MDDAQRNFIDAYLGIPEPRILRYKDMIKYNPKTQRMFVHAQDKIAQKKINEIFEVLELGVRLKDGPCFPSLVYKDGYVRWCERRWTEV